MNWTGGFTRAVLGSLMVLALAACGTDSPTAVSTITNTVDPSTPERPRPITDGLSMEAEPIDASIDILMLSYSSTPSSTTRFILASEGGEVVCGRFKVTIPKWALEADTNITVLDPGSGYLMCDLEPHDLTFEAPVRLEMGLVGLSLGSTAGLTIFWLDEETGSWVDQHGDYKSAPSSLIADLKHFSRYAGGRTGR